LSFLVLLLHSNMPLVSQHFMAESHTRYWRLARAPHMER